MVGGGEKGDSSGRVALALALAAATFPKADADAAFEAASCADVGAEPSGDGAVRVRTRAVCGDAVATGAAKASVA